MNSTKTVQQLAELLLSRTSGGLSNDDLATALRVLHAHGALARHAGDLYLRGIALRLYNGEWRSNDMGRNWPYSHPTRGPFAVKIRVTGVALPVPIEALPSLDPAQTPIVEIVRQRYARPGAARRPTPRRFSRLVWTSEMHCAARQTADSATLRDDVRTHPPM